MSSPFSQGSSLTSCPHPSQSALCAQSHLSPLKGHNLHSSHVHPSQPCVLKVISLHSRVITYKLVTSIPVSPVCSRSSLFSQGPSLTNYSRPSQSALCAQSYRPSAKAHHLLASHVHPSQPCVLKVISLKSRVITYKLVTSIPVSPVCSKSSPFSQGSSLTSCPRPSQSALCAQSHRPSAKGHNLHPIHVHPSQHLYDLECSLDGNFYTCLSATLLPDDSSTDPAAASAEKTNTMARDSTFILTVMLVVVDSWRV